MLKCWIIKLLLVALKVENEQYFSPAQSPTVQCACLRECVFMWTTAFLVWRMFKGGSDFSLNILSGMMVFCFHECIKKTIPNTQGSRHENFYTTASINVLDRIRPNRHIQRVWETTYDLSGLVDAVSHYVTKNTCVAAGVGVEGERVGEGEGDAVREVHGGAEQIVSRRRRRPLHPYHQQRDGVWLPVHLQLHGLELVRPWHHDHNTGGERCVRSDIHS